MADQATLLYLEPDDEITSVVRRLREAEGPRVVLVASGRSKATTSAVALRLLAGVADEEGREVSLVADASGRALAAEAGIPAYASVTDATAEDAKPPEPPAPRRAPIRVVRGDEARVTGAPPVAVQAPAAAAPASGPSDETIAVPVVSPPPPPAPARRRVQPRPLWTRGRPLPRAVGGALVALLLLSVGALAAVAPAASIVIAPNRLAIEPVSYTLSLPVADTEEGELTSQVEGEATGVFRDPSRATGVVTFSNWNTVSVEVPQGTQVAAGETLFETVERIVVPFGFFTPFAPGEASVGVVAVEAGPGGNVEAEAIDFVVTEGVRGFLRGLPDNPNRLVRNDEPTAGGAENRQPEVTPGDVDAAARRVADDLASQLDEVLGADPELLYAPLEAAEPRIDVPDDLVGRRGDETFELSGTLAYRRGQVSLSEVEAAARERLLDDPEAVPEGRRVAAETIVVEVDSVEAAGEELTIRVTLRAEADPVLDEGAIRDLVAGLTAGDAEAQLAWLGEVEVGLWPGWVDRVPQLEWRIDLRVEEAPRASTGPSGSFEP
jgi:hypothetical protein